jgi:hypothetical protein
LYDILAFTEFLEILIGHFDAHRGIIGEACDAKHFLTHHKAKMVFPFYAFGSAGKAQAYRAEFFCVHGAKLNAKKKRAGISADPLI